MFWNTKRLLIQKNPLESNSFHTSVHIRVCMCMCVYVFMYVRILVCMYVCKYTSAHACLHMCTGHVPILCLDRFWINFCLQLCVPNLRHGTVQWLSSSALLYFNSAVLGMSCLHLLSYVDSLTHLTQTDFLLNAHCFLCLSCYFTQNTVTMAAMAKSVTHTKRFQLFVAQHLSDRQGLLY
jgi:hypothetical protein